MQAAKEEETRAARLKAEEAVRCLSEVSVHVLACSSPIVTANAAKFVSSTGRSRHV